MKAARASAREAARIAARADALEGRERAASALRRKHQLRVADLTSTTASLFAARSIDRDA